MAHKPLSAGELRTKVEIQENRGTLQGGQRVPHWVTVFTRTARFLSFAAGKEVFRNSQVTHTSVREITLWGDASTRTITERHRIIAGGKVWNIVDVLNVEERGLEIAITAIQGEGGWVNLGGDAVCTAEFAGEAA